MKKLFILLFIIIFTNCEKDDICDENTATTPLLKIGFYKADEPTVASSISDLKITSTEFGVFKEAFSGSTISIPLNTNATSTKFIFISNNKSDEFRNTDYLEFKYTTNNIYVSRACGFKTIFNLTDENIFDASQTDTDLPWINYEIQTTTIVNPNEIHLKIFL